MLKMLKNLHIKSETFSLDAVIKKQHDQRKDPQIRRRNHKPSKDSPDLSLHEDTIGIQGQEVKEVRINQLNKISQRIAGNQNQRQIRNGVFPKFLFKITHSTSSFHQSSEVKASFCIFYHQLPQK